MWKVLWKFGRYNGSLEDFLEMRKVLRIFFGSVNCFYERFFGGAMVLWKVSCKF